MFQFEVYGKWILAGEHAVLRGSPALVFPLKSTRIEGQWRPNSEQELQVVFSGPHSDELELPFLGALEKGLAQLGRKRSELKGELGLDSRLPLGRGLGGSAAICAVLARWWQHLGWVSEEELLPFAQRLEDLFHGESSGVDIAAALSQQGLLFVRGQAAEGIELTWKPHWYLSYCGHRGVTADCIDRVKAMAKTDSKKSIRLDNQMREAVLEAHVALGLSEPKGLPRLASAINMARDCFESWGLVEGGLERHMQELLQAGALAVKPTGSGGGGYALSLWSNPQQVDTLVPEGVQPSPLLPCS